MRSLGDKKFKPTNFGHYLAPSPESFLQIIAENLGCKKSNLFESADGNVTQFGSQITSPLTGSQERNFTTFHRDPDLISHK